jgi:hypothetical protein
MVNSKSIINKKIKKLYIELAGFTDKSNLSNASFEIILEVTDNDESELIRFIADFDKVEIQKTAILKDEKIYQSLENVLNDENDKTIFKIIDLTEDTNFRIFIDQYISRIELEKFVNGELVGFRVSMNNGSSFEIYPNGYMTSGHFNNVKYYFQQKIKFLHYETFWEIQ